VFDRLFESLVELQLMMSSGLVSTYNFDNRAIHAEVNVKMSTDSMPFPNLPLRYDVEVSNDGRIELQSSLPPGSHVTVIVVDQENAEIGDLLHNCLSSTDFWDNPADDEDWNHA
jgi:hypothetical protein